MTVKIHFLTWPDGKLFEKTQTSVSERHAWSAAIHSWLPRDWFPGLDLGLNYGSGSEIIRSMERAGFKCHTIDVDETLANGVSQ